MSDFERVLERLVTDAAFAKELAGDPDTALRGYTLSAEERELLRAQIIESTGESGALETRTSKSGVVGLLGPLTAVVGLVTDSPGEATLGAAPKGAEFYGGKQAGEESFGSRPAAVMGTRPHTGPHPHPGTDPECDVPGELARNYFTRVDVDGDGTWDPHVAYQRIDGGVDIYVDLNQDGRVDFVGHDDDRDGLVDYADFDNDFDGTFETRMYDDTGDGWMDREEKIK